MTALMMMTTVGVDNKDSDNHVKDSVNDYADEDDDDWQR